MMAKQKIEAGKELDFATPAEVGASVREALEEQEQRKSMGPLIVHIPTVRVALEPDMSATLMDADGHEITPASGRIWSIRRVSIHAEAPLDLHISSATPSTYIAKVDGVREFGSLSLLLRAGLTLSVKNTTDATVTAITNLVFLDVPQDQESLLY